MTLLSSVESSASARGPRSVRKLSADLIHRIAAGEIIESPASVIKELVDNALDAGAGRVRVTIVGGGERGILVEDDGWGMTRDDLEASIQRHATSKISTVDDLDRIFTLGFRGEALAAVASVSRLTIETAREGRGAWALEVVGGDRRPLRLSPRLRGTSVYVEDLFFNVPARRKFLRKPGTLVSECRETLENLAAAHPSVAFEWYFLDEKGEVKSRESLMPSSSLLRFEALCGVKGEFFSREAVNLEPGVRRLEILGLRPPATARTQKSIRFLVNGRPVLDKRLPFVAREAFAGLIEVGHFPILQIRLEVDPSRVDVNVHPQKKEVRWPSDFPLTGLVYGVLRAELDSASPRPSPGPTARLSEQFEAYPLGPAHAGLPADVGPLESGKATRASAPSEPIIRVNEASRPAEASAQSGRVELFYETSPRPAFRFSELRVIGEAGGAWILCESPRGIVLIDQHAAHERVNFERCLRQPGLLRSKPLLVPHEVALPWSLESHRAEIIDALEMLGFELSDLSRIESCALEIVAVPDADRRLDWRRMLRDCIEDLEAGEAHDSRLDRLKASLAASLACHGSVRRGQRLANDEIRALLEQMDRVEWGGLCPHGRPLWIECSHERIESLFHR